VIEDDAAVREVVADLLLFEGFAVATARDEPQSADRLARDQFDLIVTDLFVPSSQAALDRVRNLQLQVGATPILVMTANWFGWDLTAEKLGVADLIFKPFDVEPFVEHVRALVRRADSAAEIPWSDPMAPATPAAA